jgi:hypothetical protein
MRNRREDVERFFEACEQQEVSVHEALASAHANGSLYKEAHPARILLEEMGIALMKGRAVQLGDKPVELPDDLADDFLMATAGRIFNSSVEPVFERPGMVSVNCLNAGDMDHCEYAEEAFGSTLTHMRKLNKHGEMDFPFQAFEHDNQVVLLRKGEGEPTALTLTDINLRGIPFPAGSIMSVIATNYEKFKRERGEPMVLPTPALSGLSFLRLSHFAFAQKDRRGEGFHPWAEDSRSWTFTLDQVRTGVVKALQKLEEIDYRRTPEVPTFATATLMTQV